MIYRVRAKIIKEKLGEFYEKLQALLPKKEDKSE